MTLYAQGKKGVTRDFGVPATITPFVSPDYLCLSARFRAKITPRRPTMSFQSLALVTLLLVPSSQFNPKINGIGRNRTRSRLFRPFRGLSPLHRDLVGTSIRP